MLQEFLDALAEDDNMSRQDTQRGDSRSCSAWCCPEEGIGGKGGGKEQLERKEGGKRDREEREGGWDTEAKTERTRREESTAGKRFRGDVRVGTNVSPTRRLPKGGGGGGLRIGLLS